MKIFISWSGDRSHHIAKALHAWLPTVLHGVKPFLSSVSIEQGERGGEVIAAELENSKVGIVCLTPENLTSPWILFESGALSKITSAPVCTYLFDLKPSDIKPPLSTFQHTQTTETDTLKLLKSINKLREEKLENDVIETVFHRSWADLKKQIDTTPVREAKSESTPRTLEDKVDELLLMVRDIRTIRKLPFSSRSLFSNPTLRLVEKDLDPPLSPEFFDKLGDFANRERIPREQFDSEIYLSVMAGLGYLEFDTGRDHVSLTQKGRDRFFEHFGCFPA